MHGQAFSELKMPYDAVVAADFADLECKASAKSVLFAQCVNSNGAAEICRYGKDYSMELWMKTDYTEKRSCETGHVRNTDPRAGWQQKYL